MFLTTFAKSSSFNVYDTLWKLGGACGNFNVTTIKPNWRIKKFEKVENHTNFI